MMWELVRQESVKLFAQRFPWVLLGLVLALQTARTLSLAFTPAQTSLDVVSAPQLWADGAGWGLRFAAYALLVLGAMSLSREFSLGTAKTMLVLPISRAAWVGAKLILLVALGSGLVLVITLWGAALTALTLGWGTVMREGLVLVTGGETFVAILSATLLTLVFFMPVCAFAMVIGMLFTSSGSAVGMALVSGLVLETISGLFTAGRFVFFSYLGRPSEVVLRMGKGLPYQWGPLLTWGLLVCLLSFAAFTVLLFWWMNRRDITD